MIETETIWEDSGFDCEHCGGVILKRIDRETGLPDRICFQCRECSCQWNLDGEMVRVGTLAACKSMATARQEVDLANPAYWLGLLSRNLWLLLAIVAGVILLRFGGGAVARFLLPVAFLGVGIYLLVRYGQKQQWW